MKENFKIRPRNANLVCPVAVAGINLSTPLKDVQQTQILSETHKHTKHRDKRMNTAIFRQKSTSSDKHESKIQTMIIKQTNIEIGKQNLIKIACTKHRNTNRKLLLEATKQLPAH